jgi:thiol-disulfide isomerase/thioredoxin
MNDFNSNRVYYLENSDITPARTLVQHTQPDMRGIVVVMIQGNFCKHCTNTKPAFQQLAHDIPLTCATIRVDGGPNESLFQDADAVTQLAGHRLRGVPTIMRFKGGVPFDVYTGSDRSYPALRAYAMHPEAQGGL